MISGYGCKSSAMRSFVGPTLPKWVRTPCVSGRQTYLLRLRVFGKSSNSSRTPSKTSFVQLPLHSLEVRHSGDLTGPRGLQSPRRKGGIACPATGGGDKPPSGGGPPRKPPSGPNEESGGADSDDEDIIGLDEAEQIAASGKVQLPADFAEAAAGQGLRRSVLDSFISLQQGWLTSLLANKSTFFRDRLLFDSRFLFIVLAEIAIDTACATIAEVRKRGKDFWSEFEFYLSDLTVGLVLDVLLVGLMATPVVIGKHHKAHNARGFKKLLARTPKAVFEANTPGEPRYTVFQRLFCLVVKFGEYSLAGITCGIVGQALTNGLMVVKRQVVGAQEGDNEAPPIILTGLTWGAFMGGSSNLRYQAVFALERLVDKTIAKPLPKAPYIISFVLRLVNNVVGGENFIDHARWTGIQPSTEQNTAPMVA